MGRNIPPGQRGLVVPEFPGTSLGFTPRVQGRLGFRPQVFQMADFDTTITFTRYNEPAWLIKDTLVSLSEQKDVRALVLVLDQYEPDDGTEELCRELSSEAIRFEYSRIPARSLSFSRNEAIARTQTSSLLFIDSDAIAEPDWAAEMLRILEGENVGIAGGRILPKWHRRPLLLAKSNLVMDQYSVLDFGNGAKDVDRIVGANFGLNVALLGEHAYFDEALGRREGKLFSGEESDLCARTMQQGHRIRYSGASVVHHQILPERIRYRWVWRRMYYAGYARAQIGGAPRPSKPWQPWDYFALAVVLPAYALGYWHGKRALDS